MMPVNLSKTLEGHVILWCKGHYRDRGFDEVISAYTGWTGTHGVKERTRILMRSLMATGQGTENMLDQVMDSFFYKGAISCRKPTSYHVLFIDKIDADVLSESLRSIIQALVTVKDYQNPDITTLVLPDLMEPERFEKWQPKG